MPLFLKCSTLTRPYLLPGNLELFSFQKGEKDVGSCKGLLYMFTQLVALVWILSVLGFPLLGSA